jgi:hypothetical protein
MIRIMNILSITMMLLFAISCNQFTNQEKTTLNMIEFKKEDQSKIDSVIVKYWKSTEANEYMFYYSDEMLQISSEYFDFKKRIEDKHISQEFKKYVNQFYIDKEKKIILKRTKRGYLESTDYPYIKVVGYQNKKEVFNVTTQIGEEEYDVEYHPEFIEFYKFLDGLVKEK